MTTEELKQKHFKAHWNTSEETAEKHRDISIEFAIECMQEILRQPYVLHSSDLSDKINELKQNLK